MSTTKIEWCDITINPIVGCSKCSPGCDNCYAEKFAARLAKNPKTANKYDNVVDENGKWNGNICVEGSVFDRLPAKPKRIFVGSMCDMFHESVYSKTLEYIFREINAYRKHTFMILTKRPERMLAFFANNNSGKLPNLWLGVTVCNQAEADEKIPLLLQTPAAKRFVSIEPMLGPVNLSEYSGLDWVICGGETGPSARPMHTDWARSLRDQCAVADTPFFFKGHGGRVKNRLLDGVEHNAIPEV